MSLFSTDLSTNKESVPVYDVAILSDFRYPGCTSASIAAEVHAQA